MIYFALWVLSMVALFVVFRLFPRFQVNTLHAIVINYWVCVCSGTLLAGELPIPPVTPETVPWLVVAGVLGTIFVSTFYVTAITTQKAGVMVTTLASRMSFFLPMLFTLFVLNIENTSFLFSQYVGVAVATVAIGLSIYKPPQNKQVSSTKKTPYSEKILLPLAVFFISGSIDTVLNYTNHELLQEKYQKLFTTLLFGVAALAGTLYLIFQSFSKKVTLSRNSIIGGICLGIPNYFSIYLVLVVLEQFNNNGAEVFPLFNVSVIAVATLISVFFFKEKLFWYNKLGLLFTGVAIYLIAFSKHFRIGELVKHSLNLF